MRTETILKTIYNIDDVLKNETLKQKVLQKHSDINTDYDWYNFTLNDFENELNQQGFEDVNISFSVFYSQGDGASFTCKSVDLDKLANILFDKQLINEKNCKLIMALYNNGYIYASIYRHNTRYCHERSTTFCLENNFTHEYKRVEKILCNFENVVSDYIVNINCHIYDKLEKEYEYLQSDKAIIETLEANNYEFDENGNIY